MQPQKRRHFQDLPAESRSEAAVAALLLGGGEEHKMGLTQLLPGSYELQLRPSEGAAAAGHWPGRSTGAGEAPERRAQASMARLQASEDPKEEREELLSPGGV